ncbi:MAG: hypothetical protein NC319_09665 [Butyricicoccus sp.]|nr:hypothetical protein [Butyricicoccus sp.]
MNAYKITYILNGTEHYDHITERTEKAAQKRLKGIYKDAEIIDTELTSTEAQATKEQEREALEKIKALVAELGPQSYLATAFDGVFDDAETNIENDFAFSMKARFEDSEKRLREMGSVYNAAKMDAVHLQEQLTAAQEQLAEAQEEAEALRGKQLPAWLHSAVYSLAVMEIADTRKQMEQSAETMAHFADSPQDIAFAAAVKSYRAAKERRGSCEQIVAGLEALTEK